MQVSLRAGPASGMPPMRQPRLRHATCQAAFGGFGGGTKRAPTASSPSTRPCPCGSGDLYSGCCQPYHKSTALTPPTPEAALRARYSAFVKRDARYIDLTTHPDNPARLGSHTAEGSGVDRVCSFEDDIRVTMKVCRFTRMELLGSRPTPGTPSRAEVDYRVSFQRIVGNDGAKLAVPLDVQLTERAICVADEDGRWLVLDVHDLDVAALEDGAGGDAAEAAAAAATPAA